MSNLSYKQGKSNPDHYLVYNGDVLIGSVYKTTRLTPRGEKRCWLAEVTGRSIGVGAHRAAAAKLLVGRRQPVQN